MHLRFGYVILFSIWLHYIHYVCRPLFFINLQHRVDFLSVYFFFFSLSLSRARVVSIFLIMKCFKCCSVAIFVRKQSFQTASFRNLFTEKCENIKSFLLSSFYSCNDNWIFIASFFEFMIIMHWLNCGKNRSKYPFYSL